MSKKSYDEDDLKRVAGMVAEELKDQLEFVVEAVGDIRKQVVKLPAMREDIDELKSDIKVIKAAVTDTNKDLHHLEKRVSRLRAA